MVFRNPLARSQGARKSSTLRVSKRPLLLKSLMRMNQKKKNTKSLWGSLEYQTVKKKKKSGCCPHVHNGLWSRSYVTQPSAKVEDRAMSSHRRHEFTQAQWVGTSAAGPCLSLSRRSDSSWNPCGDLLSSLLLAAASLPSTCVPWSCLDLHPASL